jgi:hypothetical protein
VVVVVVVIVAVVLVVVAVVVVVVVVVAVVIVRLSMYPSRTCIRGGEAQLHSFLPSALDGRELLASLSSRHPLNGSLLTRGCVDIL